MIEISGLYKSYGRTPAVDGIDLEVQAGEVFGLLGPNGAGKTTTIRVLTTLIRPTAGSVRVAGLDVRRDGAALRRLLGYVPQTMSTDGALTGYENLLLVARLLGLSGEERRRRIQEVLEILNLEEAAGRLVRTYSGGMVRRLEVGQAVLHRPRILVLDEPTVGLDPTARGAMWQMLQNFRREGLTTILITTHYMEEAEAYCERLAIMNRGRIAAQGTPAELKAEAGGVASLEEVFTAVTGDTLESGGSYRDLRQIRRRTRRV